jgi:hypothetical protein
MASSIANPPANANRGNANNPSHGEFAGFAGAGLSSACRSSKEARLSPFAGRQVYVLELLQSVSGKLPANVRVDQVTLDGVETCGKLVIDNTQLIEPLGFLRRQLAEKIALQGIVVHSLLA